jgi:trk system potassium uptake protein
MMLTSLPYAFANKGNDQIPIIIAAGISLLCGSFLNFLTKGEKQNLGRKEGYFIVSTGWIVISFFGALPFYISREIPDFTDAFFETISGFTTTGASILNDIESMSKGLLYWRSMTQWIGGMGIIVLTIAIIPFLGIGGMQLYIAEVPGLSYDKLHPRIKETAKRLWGVYLFLTLLEFILLWAGGMSTFDAINHAFTTMATGGYSTKQASIAFFQNPFIHYVIIVFMFLAGTNFILSFLALKGKPLRLFKNAEFKFYIIILLLSTILISLLLYFNQGNSEETAFRNSLFQVVSITTTTGFVTDDYQAWTAPAFTILLLLFFIGGCAGSTGGGVKVIRHLLLFKNISMEFKRLVHPRAVIHVRLENKMVPPVIISNVITFIFLYIIILIISTVLMLYLGLDLKTAFGAVASTLGNIGPGAGSVGPIDNYAHIPALGKWLLSFLMLLGRLELFTVMVLFTRSFWRK